MSSLGVNSVVDNSYSYKNMNRKVTTNIKSFENEVKRASDIGNTAIPVYTPKFEGDMIINQPPNYSNLTYDNAILNKSKDEMTMGEYKQYIMNEMSKIPVSSYYQASFSGSLIIKEEAFEKMKSDPEWEKTVLNMLRKMYSVNGLPQRSYCIQVIGASEAECYGYSVPMDNGSNFLTSKSNQKSWCQKRHEKMEEQVNKPQQKNTQQQAQDEQEYARQMYVNSQRILNLFNLNTLKSDEIDEQAFMQAMSSGAVTYRKFTQGQRVNMSTI